MAININCITDDNAHNAFLNRIVARFRELHPDIDPRLIEPQIHYLFSYTIANLDVLASELHVDVEWLLTGHGSCLPITRQ